MKKLLFGLSFFLVGTVAFANPIKLLENTLETSSKHLPIENAIDCKDSLKNIMLSNTQILDGNDCTITTDVKITKDGKTTTVKGTVTVSGVSCAELLKSLIK
ncbi:hypothetical protein [Flavobacterium sp.]|uniref:hypothetical protein n=1 Tax=Flavobacterium sp. TaxID=239 RepID=UPI002633309E|nr:hypothetical protein [Flavobacterium sp.]MDD3004386.1 hypothetical protein [Flavobacterium sp.]